MILELHTARIYRAVQLAQVISLSSLRLQRNVYGIIALVSGSGWAATSLAGFSIGLSGALYQAICLISGALFGCLISFERYVYFYLQYPPLRASDNIAEYISFGPAHALDNAVAISRKRGESEVSSMSVLEALLSDPSLSEALVRVPQFAQVRDAIAASPRSADTMSRIVSAFGSHQYSQTVTDVLTEAYQNMQRRDGERISSLDIMVALSRVDAEIQRLLVQQDIRHQDLEELSYWYEHIWTYRQAMRRFWSLENLLRQPPIGKDWMYGFLPHLSAFGTNLTLDMRYRSVPFKLASRAQEIERMEQILTRGGENNVLLVGLEGVGKTRLVEDFAEMIAHGRALPALNYKHVFQLNMATVTSASKTAQDVQNMLLAIFNEAVQAGNVIVVIDDIHNYVGELKGLGRIDITQILLPYLKSSRVQLVATTDPASYHRFIEARSELAAVFDRIDVREPDATHTLRMLEELVPIIERQSGTLITYGALTSVIESADAFITSAPFPEKAVDLLSEVVAYASSRPGNNLVSVRDVDEVVTRKTGVPRGPVQETERDKLSHFEELMHAELVGQDRAVAAVSSTLRRLRAGLSKRGRPAGVFLFVGPTGVGKTLTAKILARTYFGADDRMLRFDMSEFQDIDAIDRFLGNLKTNTPGQFVTMVRDQPFSLILLDELEKANKNVLNIFLQIFDEGHVTDVFGHRVSLEQNIIIATSNAGAGAIRDVVQSGGDPAQQKEHIVDVIIKEGAFTPEFVNRFDEVVVFHPLSSDHIRSIGQLLLQQLVQRLAQQGFVYEVTPDVIDYVAQKGFDPQFGARPMQRAIRDSVENAIARKILHGDIKKGVPFSVSVSELTA